MVIITCRQQQLFWSTIDNSHPQHSPWRKKSKVWNFISNFFLFDIFIRKTSKKWKKKTKKILPLWESYFSFGTPWRFSPNIKNIHNKKLYTSSSYGKKHTAVSKIINNLVCQSSIVMLVGGCKVQMQSQMYRWFSKLHTDRYLSYFIFFPLKFFTDTRIETDPLGEYENKHITGTVDSLMWLIYRNDWSAASYYKGGAVRLHNTKLSEGRTGMKCVQSTVGYLGVILTQIFCKLKL